ncbi:hypothetical protein LMG26411_06462 [Cupriavidus numazuensis]|uniref:Uncharacterized protein n=1 Tax=Cupriavidus numazuensis TaxID=221992 RepID=A0ABM8TS58_9BURK|nr:hypothetical protein LMG26411_06462 [Cupriavidus numazuensis]
MEPLFQQQHISVLGIDSPVHAAVGMLHFLQGAAPEDVVLEVTVRSTQTWPVYFPRSRASAPADYNTIP